MYLNVLQIACHSSGLIHFCYETYISNFTAMAKGSCKEIYDDDNTAVSGLYTITPTNNKENSLSIVICPVMEEAGL